MPFLRILIFSALIIGVINLPVQASELIREPVEACLFPLEMPLNESDRYNIAQCLGWQDNSLSLCQGAYPSVTYESLESEDLVRVQADEVSFYSAGKSELKGHVNVRQGQRAATAKTAYIYREAGSQKITRIELVGDVHLAEPDRLLVAQHAEINPQDNSGQLKEVLYRFSTDHAHAELPAWGRASLIQRFANQDYLLEKATYTTCRPQDRSWHIEANTIKIDNTKHQGVARHAKFYIGDTPILYTPYLSFPTSKERKSGFLMPTKGYSNIGGFDFSLPYYLNIAPNVDTTITPHYYAIRGVMLGDELRFLNKSTAAVLTGSFLPKDKAYGKFLQSNSVSYPWLNGQSTNRWSVGLQESTQLLSNLTFYTTYQKVSDDYYLQDFTSNLALLTERQLRQEAGLNYTNDHWLVHGMFQGYQTLRPVNETPVADIYQRLPEVMASGLYDDLPFNSRLAIVGQFDQFHMTGAEFASAQSVRSPEGPRYYLNPQLSFPQLKSWGYLTPSVELVQNFYSVTHYSILDNKKDFSRSIPRYSVDSGLYFDRSTQLFNKKLTQTLEPRLYYLNVPYHDQTPIPVYDSAYMIFNVDQLFRTNRFSGYDRIGDGNQLAYAMTTRWISDETGSEKASATLGQLYYFANRKVLLCQNTISGQCYDNPLTLGFLSQQAKTSPIAGRAMYHFNPLWTLTSDYVWNTYTRSTNNGHVDVRYQQDSQRLVNLGYTYMVNGDLTDVANSTTQVILPQDDPLHQASISAAWPLNDHWSGLGSYNYNISKQYEMMSFLGVQYDSCCWAMRLMGGRTFQSLNTALQPQYNNNVFFQVLWKGLGSVGNSDPASTIQTYLPGYQDKFH